ncbi:MAG: fused response regulator/phosphatase [Deltaproteobacteria bacterium]|nr:fused response regulator/phosphatase [Deltaproteobacteria bacterium]
MKAVILLVDDARLNREVLKLALGPAKYRFLEAANGQEAIDILQAHQVDLILLDLMTPVMDGFEFLKWRMDNPAYTSIPVIVNSALDNFDSIKKALDMESYDYFTRPLTEQDLKVILPLKVKNAINAKKTFQELKLKTERLEKEIELAGKYQRFLLPENPKLSGLKVATFYQPFIGVAGDFFDVLELGGSVAMVIADVSGHGLLSAMVSSQLKPLFARYITQTRSPSQTFIRLNHDLLQLTREEDYVSAFCAYYDFQKEELTYASAGHPDQLFFSSKTGQVKRIGSSGFLLGMFDNNSPFVQQEEITVPVEPGDRLLMFTDGTFEATSPDLRRFGFERWQKAFEAAVDKTLQKTADELWQRLKVHSGVNFQDDVAFVVIEFGGDLDL